MVAVPTNIDGDAINTTHIHTARDMLREVVGENDIVVVESSIHVGGTREFFQEFLDRGAWVGMSSERVSPGMIEEYESIPKVVSGLNEVSLNRIDELYRNTIKTTVRVTSCEVAEMTKLYENCFRLVNIAYINEVADLCRAKNINIKEVINTASTKPFGFMPFYPGFGVGGLCIPQNPVYMFNGTHSTDLPLLRLSHKLMRGRPKQRADAIQGDRIMILGTGYKENERLTAFSPALDLAKRLTELGKEVRVVESGKDCTQSLDEFKSYDTIIVGSRQNFIDWDIVNAYEKKGGIVLEF